MTSSRPATAPLQAAVRPTETAGDMSAKGGRFRSSTVSSLEGAASSEPAEFFRWPFSYAKPAPDV